MCKSLILTHEKMVQNRRVLRAREKSGVSQKSVRPAHRGRGIGRALLRKLAERCLAQGWTRLELAVLDWNQPAIDFYEAQGATLLRDWTILPDQRKRAVAPRRRRPGLGGAPVAPPSHL